jgi:hypothetical protein
MYIGSCWNQFWEFYKLDLVVSCWNQIWELKPTIPKSADLINIQIDVIDMMGQMMITLHLKNSLLSNIYAIVPNLRS